MDEYVIHAKLKNNLLLSRILKEADNVSQFCKKHGFWPSDIGDYVNLKKPALTENGWSESALKLADILGVLPDDLFSEEQQTVRLKTNQAAIEISRQRLLELADPFDAIDSLELAKSILSHSNLTSRQTQVIQMRFQEQMTLDETAKKLNVTRERVRQIEHIALGKMRRSKPALELIEEIDESEPIDRNNSLDT